jgi:hypothetical protein
MCVGSAAFGEERPTMGLLYNTSETHSLRYDCDLDGAHLECSFVQMTVRRKANPEDLAEALQKARSEFTTFQRDLPNQCKGVDAMYDAIVLGRAPPGTDMKKFAEGTAGMAPGQKADMAKMIGSWRDVCRTPTEAKFIEFVRGNHERDTRTCKVSANAYTQRFRRVNGTGPWVVVDKPSGVCGIVNVSRFEADRSVGSGLSFWRYHAKKVITNPSGKLPLFGPCDQLDEREYIYDWRSKEAFLGCDYINFSPI